MEAPFKHKDGCENNRFHHISTDEVYGNLGKQDYLQKIRLMHQIVRIVHQKRLQILLLKLLSYLRMNVVTTNCSNRPKQHDEKLIPTIIRKAISRENILFMAMEQTLEIGYMY